MYCLAVWTARPEDRRRLFDYWLFYCDQAKTLRKDELFLTEIAPFSYSHQFDDLIAVGTAPSLLQPYCYALLVKKVSAICHEKRVILKADRANFFLELELLVLMLPLRICTESRWIFQIPKGFDHYMVVLARMVSNLSGWIVSIKYPKISSPDHENDSEKAAQAKRDSNCYADD